MTDDWQTDDDGYCHWCYRETWLWDPGIDDQGGYREHSEAHADDCPTRWARLVPAEQAAIGAAMERLPDDRGWSITKNPGDDYLVEFAAPDHEIEPAAFAPTLPEAIEAALGEAEP